MMDRSTARTVGIVGGLAGAGVLGWALYPTIARSLSGITPLTIAFQPAQPTANNPFAVVVSARGKPGAQLATQGAVIQPNGQVGGHLWSSASTAAAVSETYWNTYDSTTGTDLQKAAAAEAAVSAISAQPSARVTMATAGSDGTATMTLYSEPLLAGTYTIAAWIAVPPASALIVQDAVGTAFSALQRSPAPYLALQAVLS